MFKVGDIVVVVNALGPAGEGYYGSYYNGDKGTIVDMSRLGEYVAIDFDDNRTEYSVKIEEIVGKEIWNSPLFKIMSEK